MDILAVVSYAAKYSAYNNIEHLWSPMSKKLCSVVIPSILEGDEQEPHKQRELSDAERKQKEAMVSKNIFTLSMNQVPCYTHSINCICVYTVVF